MTRRQVTGEEIKASMIDKNITFVQCRPCSICQVDIGYLRKFGDVFFDPNCGCLYTQSPLEPRAWDSVAHWVNMQTKDEIAKELAAKFGVEL